MAKVTLFEAFKGSVIIKDQPNGDVVVREGLTNGQAESLAARLNNEVQESQELQATRRQQCFSVDITYHFEFVHDVYEEDEYDGPTTIAELKADVREALDDNLLINNIDGEIVHEKSKITVTKLYDKQVPNN